MSPLTFNRRPVAAISGLAQPDRFIADLLHFGMTIALRRDFVDHHRYRQEEFLKVVKQAQAAGAEAVLVTEKDAVKLPDQLDSLAALPIYAAGIEFRCEEEIALKGLVLRSLVRRKSEQEH